MARILILGGTAQARALADRLAPDHAVTTSLAGRTATPGRYAGAVRTGGFGGADGLAAYLEDQQTEAVVDATHPFAGRISANARAACARTNTPRLQWVRPPWVMPDGADVVRVATLADAAAALPGRARRAFLTAGRDSLAAFSGVRGVWFLVRLLEAPATPLALADYALVAGRPPFDEAAEAALMREHAIDTLIAKDAGGVATEAKIRAAASLGVKIVLIDRPPPEPGPTASSLDDVLDWIRRMLSA